jgi:hypothetical protein
MYQEKKLEKLTAKIAELLTSLTPGALRDIGRPHNIPLCVPDCGWNHGEQKKLRGMYG